MRKSVIVLVWFCLFFVQIHCYQVLVGSGNDIDQHLPCDPPYNYSGSQLIYDSNYFPFCGDISEISFQYQFLSDNPELFLNDITLLIGETQLNSFEVGESAIAVDELEVCFEGNLTGDNFVATNNSGAGWLHLTLDQPYYYSKTNNLVLFFIENNPEAGSNGDNFLSFSTPENTSMCFIDLDNPIELNNLVSPLFIRNKLPNSKFEMDIDENYPQTIFPENNAVDVAVNTPLQIKVTDSTGAIITVYSATNVFDILLDDNYELIAENTYEIYPMLPFAPNCDYEWRVVYTDDGTEYASELFCFTTMAEEVELLLTNTETNNSYVELAWNNIFNNQYPYQIYRNDEAIASQTVNSFIDNQVIVGETYEYYISFFYLDGSSLDSNIIYVEIPGSENTIFDEEFENFASFQPDIGAWQNIDQDGNPTYSLTGYSYPNQGGVAGFIIFEPGATVPPLEMNISGEKCLVSFAGSLPPTSDILISPSFQTSQIEIDIYLQSYDTSWGMERVKCGVVYNNDQDNIIYFNEGNYCEIPEIMTHLNFLHQTNNVEDVITNFWLESCGIQTLMLIIDRIVISTSETSNDEFTEPVAETLMFPNPVTENSFNLVSQRGISQVRVYNLKGQLIHKKKMNINSREERIVLPEAIPSGIYLIKVNTSAGEIVKKISVIK